MECWFGQGAGERGSDWLFDCLDAWMPLLSVVSLYLSLLTLTVFGFLSFFLRIPVLSRSVLPDCVDSSSLMHTPCPWFSLFLCLCIFSVLSVLIFFFFFFSFYFCVSSSPCFSCSLSLSFLFLPSFSSYAFANRLIHHSTFVVLAFRR